jgi:tRNA(fMet)-specific endonuclease VapC
MLRFLFDTDHLTHYQHKHSSLMQRIAREPVGTVAICPITIEEALRGRLAPLARVLVGNRHLQAYAHLVATVEMFPLFPWVPFDSASENQYQRLRIARLHVGSLDLKIAAIALTNHLTVLTRNRGDFGRIPGVLLDDWTV